MAFFIGISLGAGVTSAFTSNGGAGTPLTDRQTDSHEIRDCKTAHCCTSKLATLTFEIKEPLFTEPLLDLPSGQPSHLNQSVDLK